MQNRICGILEQIITKFFKDDADEDEDVPNQLRDDLVKIKLLTILLLKIALTKQCTVDPVRAEFFFYCCYNLALKCSSVLIRNQDLYNWIDQQNYQTVSFWETQILKFEEFLYRQLNWNIDLVTPADLLTFFLETHFSSISSDAVNISICQNNLIQCFLRNESWSAPSIALGCLLHAFQDDAEHKQYLVYIIRRYLKSLEDNSLPSFNLNEIQAVTMFLSQQAFQNQDSSVEENCSTMQSDAASEEKEEQEGSNSPFNCNEIINDPCMEAEDEDLDEEESQSETARKQGVHVEAPYQNFNVLPKTQILMNKRSILHSTCPSTSSVYIAISYFDDREEDFLASSRPYKRRQLTN